MHVLLCGKFSKVKKEDIIELLDNGGATILLTPLAASKKLKSLSQQKEQNGIGNDSSTVVILCGDSRITVSKTLEKDFKDALNNSQSASSSPRKKPMLADWRWVVESVTCAKAMAPTLFEPSDRRDLWKLCSKLV
jgi:hypothetical protein